jgi:hypothetical protein
VPACGKCNQSKGKSHFAAVVGPEMWQRHIKNWRSVLDLLKESQKLAGEIRKRIATAS